MNNTMPYIDVVIPVHNSVHWLAWCLEELFKYKSENVKNIFVVDDRSCTDHALQIRKIIKNFPSVKLVLNQEKHGGFGFACNLGFANASSDLILFLNTDCLITDGVLEQLSNIFIKSSDIALACPMSNNSASLTYPIFPGRSYLDMSNLIKDSISTREGPNYVEACTIVGNCLMVKRDFFNDVGGFSAEWGDGYGEETDLQMKALKLGLKGVVHLGCYVYHFGGGTFNYENEVHKLRDKNYKLFMSKWAHQYKELSDRCDSKNPQLLIHQALSNNPNLPKFVELDVLFYLPGIDQSIGGINVVISICNELIRGGLRASCAIVGVSADAKLSDYKEPILFNFLYFVSDNEFLKNRSICSKVVISTIYTSASTVAEYARVRGSLAIQFIQGYEGYFENGVAYKEAISSYKRTEHLITTSFWLQEMLTPHLSNSQTLKRIPLTINKNIFFTSATDREYDFCLVFRGAPDKGQWILCEVLMRLLKLGFKALVFYSDKYANIINSFEGNITCVALPLDQYSISNNLRKSKVFIDASLHEGFGLFPLEAMECGCRLVVSDSGGVTDYVNDESGEIIKSINVPGDYVDAFLRQVNFNSKSENKVNQATILGESWVNYMKEITRNLSAPVFSEETIFKDNTNFKEISFFIKIKPFALDFLKKIYRVIKPYLPGRLHLALKVLVTGRI